LDGQPGIACTVMTADCLPALFCDRAGTRVAAAHAGWRGLAAACWKPPWTAWPCRRRRAGLAGACHWPASLRSGPEVRDAFGSNAEAAEAFVDGERPGKFMADIYALARMRLAARGVTAVYGGGFCTVSDPRFFSYRRTSHVVGLPPCLAGPLAVLICINSRRLNLPESTASIGYLAGFFIQDGLGASIAPPAQKEGTPCE
jgi:copper oxidase (laccase) domain-containing protein